MAAKAGRLCKSQMAAAPCTVIGSSGSGTPIAKGNGTLSKGLKQESDMSKCTFQKEEQSAVLSMAVTLALRVWFAASESLRSLLEGPALGPHPRPTESKLSGLRPMTLCFIQSSLGIPMCTMFENH